MRRILDVVMNGIVENRWRPLRHKFVWYTIMLEAKRLVAECKESAAGPGLFYTRYGEAKGDHLLGDGIAPIVGSFHMPLSECRESSRCLSMSAESPHSSSRQSTPLVGQPARRPRHLPRRSSSSSTPGPTARRHVNTFLSFSSFSRALSLPSSSLATSSSSTPRGAISSPTTALTPSAFVTARSEVTPWPVDPISNSPFRTSSLEIPRTVASSLIPPLECTDFGERSRDNEKLDGEVKLGGGGGDVRRSGSTSAVRRLGASG